MTIEGFAVVLFGYLSLALLIGCLVGRIIEWGARSDRHTPERTVDDELADATWTFPDRDVA